MNPKALRQVCVLFAATLVLLTGKTLNAQTWTEFSIGAPGSKSSTQFGPEGLRSEGMPLQGAISRAYGVPEYRIAGPEWLARDRYAITALVANPRDFQPLFQRELAERFALKAHMETRTVPVYVLKSIPGAALKSSEAGSPAPRQHLSFVKMQSVTLPEFARALSEAARRPVIDETGISGRFELFVTWTAPQDLAVAVRDQLGLQLVEEARPQEMLVVDHVEKAQSGQK